MGLVLQNNTLDASGAASGANAAYVDQVSPDAHYYFPDYAGSPDGEYMGGTASEDLDLFWTDLGNVFSNGGFPSFPGGVDAGIILGATGDPLTFTPWP